jgi:hypothetical protein
MKKLFFLSHNIKWLMNAVGFFLLRISRIFKLLFQRNRKLEIVAFNYFKNWHFNNAYLVIDYQFKNAIWFRVDSMKHSNFNKPIVIDLEKIKTNDLTFEVFGFLQKQTLRIDLQKHTHLTSTEFRPELITSQFQTIVALSNIANLSIRNVKTLVPKSQIKSFPIKIKSSNPIQPPRLRHINLKSITLNLNHYN